MTILAFKDKCVPYETFIEDVAMALVVKLKEAEHEPSDVISQRMAYRIFGEANVRRWVKQMQLEAVSRRPGKIEYRIADLKLLQGRKKDCSM